jgi:hypothetical protein
MDNYKTEETVQQPVESLNYKTTKVENGKIIPLIDLDIKLNAITSAKRLLTKYKISLP